MSGESTTIITTNTSPRWSWKCKTKKIKETKSGKRKRKKITKREESKFLYII